MLLTRMPRTVVLLVAAASLGACTLNPMTRPASVAPASGAGAPLAPQTGGMAGAEAACMAAGQERGLDVLSVVSARDVSGANGQPERDVMLRVARSGTQLDVRCNYQAETGLARIMLI